MDLLKPKQFDTVSTSSQNLSYLKSMRKPHKHSHKNKQQCELCLEHILKQEQKKTGYHNPVQQNRSYNGANDEQVRFKSVQKTRGFNRTIEEADQYSQSNNKQQNQSQKYISSYNIDYQQPIDRDNRSVTRSMVINRSGASSYQQRQSQYSEIKRIKQQLDLIQNQQNDLMTVVPTQQSDQIQKTEESQPARQNTETNQVQKTDVDLDQAQLEDYQIMSKKQSVASREDDVERQLVQLFGLEYIDKIDMEKLVEDNYEYIAHVLNYCECQKGVICQFKKDQNKKLKISFKNGFHTSYKTEFMKKDQMKLPALHTNSRIDNISQEPVTISQQTNTQGEFMRKVLEDRIVSQKRPDTLQQHGPTAKYSNYMSNFKNFSDDNSKIEKITPVDKNGIDLRFKGNSCYNEQYIKFGVKEYNYEHKKAQKGLAPFGQYIPFQNETTQLRSNKYLNKQKHQINDLKSSDSMLRSDIDQEIKNIRYKQHFDTENKKQYNQKVGEVGTERLHKKKFKKMLLEKLKNIKQG